MMRSRQSRPGARGGDPRFYLASASPRRRQLLESVGLQFEVLASAIDESSNEGESPVTFVRRMAREKADEAAARIDREGLPSLPVMAADTSVSIDERILGKPENRDHARSMLRSLSGRTHQVHTAVALKSGASVWFAASISHVTFAEITERELDAYCASGEPDDKAGAYAVQGLGAAFVKRLEGSYTGVVGLPMYETRRLLKHIDVDWL